jgi:hypothetical protein
MPVVVRECEPVFRCINHDMHAWGELQRTPGRTFEPKWSTMTRGSTALLSSVTPEGPQRIAVIQGDGVPVCVYACRVCGYVELYAALKVEPGLWAVANDETPGEVKSLRGECHHASPGDANKAHWGEGS